MFRCGSSRIYPAISWAISSLLSLCVLSKARNPPSGHQGQDWIHMRNLDATPLFISVHHFLLLSLWNCITSEVFKDDQKWQGASSLLVLHQKVSVRYPTRRKTLVEFVGELPISRLRRHWICFCWHDRRMFRFKISKPHHQERAWTMVCLVQQLLIDMEADPSAPKLCSKPKHLKNINTHIDIACIYIYIYVCVYAYIYI